MTFPSSDVVVPPAASLEAHGEGLPSSQDGTGSNPQPEPSGNDAESFILPEVTGCLSEMQAFFNAQLLPRARAIEAEVANMTYEANAVSERAEHEKAHVDRELDRLTEIVLNFQNRISQFLSFGAFRGRS